MQKADIAITHDFYLKKFQLSRPVLPYDYILFDEGQDASAAMLDVFLQQPAIKIIVGDAHQQIYGWRYAVNSLQKVDFPVYNLTNSFRFNDEIALVANKILAWKLQLKQPPSVKIIGAGQPSPVSFTKATLGRTNLGLLLNAITQHESGHISKLYFEGNINSYTFADEGASLYDVLNLHNGKRDKIKDKLIAEMTSMKDLEDYIDKTEDTSLSMIVEVVKEFGNRLPGLIAELKQNHTTKEEADMIFSTVHRCKGMEYDEVTLLNDFINEDKLRKYIEKFDGDKMKEGDRNRLAEEVNILYVAATRAKNVLKMPPDINPLKSLLVANEAVTTFPNKKYNSSYKQFDDWDMYSKSEYKKSSTPLQNSKQATKPTTNHGKKWTEEDELTLTDMFSTGKSIKEIAKQLSRGENGVRIKLINMDLLGEDE